ncbi:MAG: PBP1A family penicillin-binding protein [Spirochaetales bacterium]|nr:PBP1A family penicillin-binding protein [Spirochaetales bacterium]
MSLSHRRKIIIDIILGVVFIFSIILGILLGLALAAMKSTDLGDLDIKDSALPTQVFDINGNLISEFYTDEKREIISLDEVPDHLIQAILTREDQDFYTHNGFNLKRIISAALHLVIGQYAGGGSTITQQVAKNRYCDRTEFTLKRKLVELWYAFQLERQYTKREILEFYINEVPFGGGTNGVEAASQYYFGHSAKEITLAESVLLANVIAAPTRYSPILNPDIAKKRQKEILDQMVSSGYANREEAERSFREYWMNYDYTRSPAAIYLRKDSAPWFTWYVKNQLEEMDLSSDDIFKGGLKVYTTLNLEYQAIADEIMANAVVSVNEKYKKVNSTRLIYGDNVFLPIVDLLSLTFNIRDIRTAARKEKVKAKQYYREQLNPLVDIVSTMFNIEELKDCAISLYKKEKKIKKKTDVEGALVCIDSHTGHILAMVGGSEFDSRTNWFNRAVYANVQPGSAFKPLYYSAAIDQGRITPATMLTDAPVIFWNDDGTPYTPLNYKGRWNGRVLARDALAHSLNVPSLKVLHEIGFDSAINQASRMLGITDPKEIESNFPRKYPLGLGIIRVSPLQMVKAFAIFPNEGREVVPIAIRFIEDRYGKKILEPEKELIARQKRAGEAVRIMSPQAAYIMVDMMKSGVEYGTLAGIRNWFRDRPIAGKTGTTQNWSDAWTVGFTPQMTTAVWFGFDTPGNSLGVSLTGAAIACPAWGDFMRKVHKGLPVEDFKRAATGLVEVEVCTKSGLLPDPQGYCKKQTKKEIFMKGTEPRDYCHIHEAEAVLREIQKEHLRNTLLFDYQPDIDFSDIPPSTEEDTGTRTSTDSTSTIEGENFLDDEDASAEENDDSEADVSENNPLLDG